VTPDEQIASLKQQADGASSRDQKRQAAFLYEQARRVAADHGQNARSFSIGVNAARCWGLAGDDRRFLTVLLELLYHIPDTADPWDVYNAKEQYFWYLLEVKTEPDLDELTAQAAELDEMCSSLGHPDSNDVQHRLTELLEVQGKWTEALTQCEIGYSRSADHGTDPIAFASAAAQISLRIGRRPDAQLWLGHITSEYWPEDARTSAAYVRMSISLFDGDGHAARGELLSLDDAMQGVERPRYSAQDTIPAVATLALDPHFGDPLADSHPIARRLQEFPESERKKPRSALDWHKASVLRHLAGMRYAAGVKPVDDLYYRTPHELPSRTAARLPDQLPQRTAAARLACDEAIVVARQLDTPFRCSWREEEIQCLRQRIDEIAAVHGL
jgi:hypothetical protein